MAVPKQKQSKGRTKRRRAHQALASVKTVRCSHCKQEMQQHKVCPSCGYYKEKEIVNVLEKVKKK